SIKGLLEKSESKLNAARESIEIASPKQAAKKAEQEIAELDIPEVEEIVEIPELDEIVVPAQSADAQPTVDIEVLKAFLDEMQKQIEKTMRDKLMKAVVAAENDVKKQMRAYLDQLRKMLDQ
ncbi:MAG: hypothetical protein PVG75_13200, partial [Thioalkalispiraceae bacterium]